MKHILFTLKGCPFELLDDEQNIKMLLYNATKESKSTLLNLATHKFDPQGVTGVAMLAESHISIHTWPEKIWLFVMFLLVEILLFLRMGWSI